MKLWQMPAIASFVVVIVFGYLMTITPMDSYAVLTGLAVIAGIWILFVLAHGIAWIYRKVNA